jgi:hypothetical protein
MMLEVPKRGKTLNFKTQSSPDRSDDDISFSSFHNGSLKNSPQNLNTFKINFAECESQSILSQVYIPENASVKEKSIHKFLDSINIYTVNVKNLLEEDAKLDCRSPKVQMELSKI